MNLMSFLLLLDNILLMASVPALLLFVCFYAFGSPWRTYAVGRALMYFAAATALAAIVWIVGLYTDFDYTGREWVRLLSSGFLAITTWRLFFVLRRVQKYTNRKQ